MDGYNFWQDFFDTYQSLSDGTKALWLIVPAAFVLGLIALILRHRVASREAEHGLRGDLAYTIRKDAGGELHVYRHGAALDREPALVLLEEPNGGDGGNVHQENKGRIISSRDGV
jgi:hypothetical protein